MLDQSFSADNFKIIFDIENRRGNYLEDENFFKEDDFLKEARKLTQNLIVLNGEIREERKLLREKKELDSEKISDLKKRVLEVKEERELERKAAFQKISDNVSCDSFKLLLSKGGVRYGKQLYVVKKRPENYFVLKQLQRNIYKTFSVKQANRKSIISQLKLLLDDGFPKLVIRTDIKSFYESIPHKELLARIEENSLLSYLSKAIIKDVLNQYWKVLVGDGIKSDKDDKVGIPRGLGISAYLSELYLSDLDKMISSLPCITFYARYVDDIVIIFTPNDLNENKTAQSYKKRIERIISKYKLIMNEEKTEVFDLRKLIKDRKQVRKYEISYLGYKFIVSYKRKDHAIEKKYAIEKNALKICMSDNKLDRNRKKIKETFDEFKKNIVIYAGKERKTNKLLIQRIKILTHNFRLYRRKQFVFVGIYFSNEFLSSISDLKVLDEVLKSEVNKVSSSLSEKMKDELQKYSYVDGFINKRIVSFSFNDKSKRGAFKIERVLKIWEDL